MKSDQIPTPKVFYQEGFKYQLKSDLIVQTNIYPAKDINTEYIYLSVSGLLLLRHGYASDGPSGPTIDTKTFIRPAFTHDALYQLERLGLLPRGTWKKSDLVLIRLCKEDGMWAPRRWWVFKGLQIANGDAASIERRKPILQAP